jgi:hypothetical protein
MPPVSVTMQALNVAPPPAAAPVLDDADDDAAGVVLLELDPDDPQAAASRAIAANPAAIRICGFKIFYLLCPGAPQVPGGRRLDR